MPRRRVAVIIGAGPAGLTAALELLERTDVTPIVLEASDAIGGLARTVEYKGNRMDIGGHRFFSKSERVNAWWLRQMPREAAPENADHVLLLRPRRSRIYFLRQFFAYPLALSADTLRRLGWRRSAAIAASYAAAHVRPQTAPRTMEEFFVQRFGRRLYETFFKSYTEKVWGVPCAQIPARWGAQRIRGLSLWRAVWHELRRRWWRPSGAAAETSLCEQFLYPKLGPGQMWEHVAKRVVELGGEVRLRTSADRLCMAAERVAWVETVDAEGRRERLVADLVFSTMPVPALLRALGNAVPPRVRALGQDLRFRDFVTVGLLVRRMLLTRPDGTPLDDTWLYIQEPGIRMGRLQIFNHWSPALVADPETLWLGLEYFCDEGDDLWSMTDEALQAFAAAELAAMGMVRAEDVVDGHVVRAPKAYPAYLGTYDHFDEIRNYTDGIANLFLIGRNGMHRYNNQDHSMLAAMTAVDQVAAGYIDREELWSINTEPEYHEQK